MSLKISASGDYRDKYLVLLTKIGKLLLLVAQTVGYHWNVPKEVANVTYDSVSILKNAPGLIYASSSISRMLLKTLLLSIKTTHMLC